MIETLVSALDQYYSLHQPAEKASAIEFLTRNLHLLPGKSVYLNSEGQYVIRFCYSADETFSNTVLSLKTVLKHDHLPLMICLIRKQTYQLFLANTTLINKVSHSSHNLRPEKIVGSFTGSDILREIDTIPNTPENFTTLFALHSSIDTQENINRIIENTSQITATKTKTDFTAELRQQILQSVALAFNSSYPDRIAAIGQELDTIVAHNSAAIIESARREPTNINLRGNQIEQIITGSINEHKFEDYSKVFEDGTRAFVDIKTHIVGLGGSPKHQNIEKFLISLAEGNVLSFIYFVIIDISKSCVKTVMINNLEKNLLDRLRIQQVWAGRNSRGVTQIDNDVHIQLEQGWKHIMDHTRAVQFIDQLIAR